MDRLPLRQNAKPTSYGRRNGNSLADVEISFQILCIRYIEQCILPLVVPVGPKEIRETIQYIAGRLHIKTDAQGIATVIHNTRCIALRIIGKTIA